jgi:hypothetical protein
VASWLLGIQERHLVRSLSILVRAKMWKFSVRLIDLLPQLGNRFVGRQLRSCLRCGGFEPGDLLVGSRQLLRQGGNSGVYSCCLARGLTRCGKITISHSRGLFMMVVRGDGAFVARRRSAI